MQFFFCFFQVGRIPFNQQIRNFENTLDQITDRLGADGVAAAISKCLFFVGMGSNDYLNNYMMPNYNTRNQYNPQQYADLLVQQYTIQLTVSCVFESQLPFDLVLPPSFCWHLWHGSMRDHT